MRFPCLCAENYSIDGDHTRERSRPYARFVDCICAYARRQSMVRCYKNIAKLRICAIKPHDVALLILFAMCREVSPLSAWL